MGRVQDPERFRTNICACMERHLQRDVLILMAVEAGKPAPGSLACLMQTLPLLSCLSGKTEKLLSKRRGKAGTALYGCGLPAVSEAGLYAHDTLDRKNCKRGP